MNWRQVPQAVEPENRVPLVLPLLLAVIPLGGVMAAYDYGGRLIWVAVVLGGVALGMRAVPSGLPVYVALATAAITAATDAQFGWHLALVGVVPLGLWMVATGSSAPPYRWLPDGRLFRVCLVPVALAGASLVVEDELWNAQRLVALACVTAVVVVILPRSVDRVLTRVEQHFGPVGRYLAFLQRFLAVTGRHLGRALGVVVMVPAAALLSIAWGSQRLVGVDPLRAPAARGGQWVRRAGGDAEPHRLFATTATLDPGGTGWKVRRGAAAGLTALVVVLLLGAAAPAVRRVVADSNEALGSPLPFVERSCDLVPDPAMDRDPGWPRVFCDIGDYAVNGRFSAVTTYSMADHTSATVNVRHGVRTTWRPPECDCRRVRLWMFGGSAAFGWWQRDDLTIASQLAELAWEDGIALDIELRANPGWVLGQEQRLFAELSVTEQELPDVVLFYDGGNELQRQRYRNDVGRGDDESQTSYAEEEIDRLLSEGPFPWYAGEELNAAAAADGRRLPGDEVARHATARYLRDLELARRSTDAAGVEAVFVWQPLLVAAGRGAGNPDALDDEEWGFGSTMVETARSLLPDDVVDLSDVFDDVDHPIFKDLYHHNVEGSGIIAEALLDELGPSLRGVADG